jgi:hypothetical protein
MRLWENVELDWKYKGNVHSPTLFPPIPHPMAPPKYSKIAYNNICNP